MSETWTRSERLAVNKQSNLSLVRAAQITVYLPVDKQSNLQCYEHAGIDMWYSGLTSVSCVRHKSLREPCSYCGLNICTVLGAVPEAAVCTNRVGGLESI